MLAMLRILGLLVVLMVPLWGQEAKEVKVKARLTEVSGSFPPNDLYKYVYVFKYQVLSVEEGELSDQEILVAQYDPRTPRTQVQDSMDSLVNGNVQEFRAGDKHILRLKQPLESFWQGAVEDEYFDDERLRWFAVESNKLP
jgi:hypothetical protein